MQLFLDWRNVASPSTANTPIAYSCPKTRHAHAMTDGASMPIDTAMEAVAQPKKAIQPPGAASDWPAATATGVLSHNTTATAVECRFAMDR